MAAAAAIAAAAITAAATVGTTVYASQQQQAAAKAAGRAPSQTNVALPGRAAAIGRYADQLLALNATKQPSSFGDWVSGGGKGTFPLTDPGFSPQMAQQLGFVGKHGQLMYLSQWLRAQGNLDPRANINQLVDAWKAANLAGGHPGPKPVAPGKPQKTSSLDRILSHAPGAVR
jgi:hypothetical protein